ncbi:MAG: LysR family transcriptional regulator [Janthinobacterium lividum]
MTPEQLVTFAAVAEWRNISRAAIALHLSQPAVSGQLRLLKEECGEPLYHREGRGIRLTPAGSQLALHAQALRAHLRHAQALVGAWQNLDGGVLRVGASTTPASYLLPHLLASFLRRHPAVSLSTFDGNSTEIVARLLSFDIAMIEGPVPPGLPPDVGVQRWCDDEIVAIAPATHPLAQRAALAESTLADLARYPLILRERGSGVRQAVESAFLEAGTAPQIALELSGVEAVKEAVRAGMGIGFVSAMSMRYPDSRLLMLRIGPAGLRRSFSLLVPHASAPSRAAQLFLSLCLDGVTGEGTGEGTGAGMGAGTAAGNQENQEDAQALTPSPRAAASTAIADAYAPSATRKR